MAVADIAARALRLLPAERAHEETIRILNLAGSLLPKVQADDERLAVQALGMRFPNPIGLAAGFDKDARVPDAILRKLRLPTAKEAR